MEIERNNKIGKLVLETNNLSIFLWKDKDTNETWFSITTIIDGKKHYNNVKTEQMIELTKTIIDLKLKPNKQYIVWLNTQKFKNFQDMAGNPAIPCRFVFKTE